MTVADPISISVKQAAEMLGISRDHAYDLNAAGQLPGAYRLGGRILVHVPTLMAEIESRAKFSTTGRPTSAAPLADAAGGDTAIPGSGPARGGAR